MVFPIATFMLEEWFFSRGVARGRHIYVMARSFGTADALSLLIQTRKGGKSMNNCGTFRSNFGTPAPQGWGRVFSKIVLFLHFCAKTLCRVSGGVRDFPPKRGNVSPSVSSAWNITANFY